MFALTAWFNWLQNHIFHLHKFTNVKFKSCSFCDILFFWLTFLHQQIDFRLVQTKLMNICCFVFTLSFSSIVISFFWPTLLHEQVEDFPLVQTKLMNKCSFVFTLVSFYCSILFLDQLFLHQRLEFPVVQIKVMN